MSYDKTWRDINPPHDEEAEDVLLLASMWAMCFGLLTMALLVMAAWIP